MADAFEDITHFRSVVNNPRQGHTLRIFKETGHVLCLTCKFEFELGERIKKMLEEDRFAIICPFGYFE